MAEDMGVLAREFNKGLWKELPVIKVVLGLCPTLAVSSTVINSLGMGVATTAVLIVSNIAIAMLRNVIPAKVRIPAFIVVIASFVTIIDLLMNAYVHDLHKALGIFIPLIVVNCILLGRAEAYASKNGVLKSAADGIGMGLGFTLVLLAVGTLRELLGSGTLLGYSVLGSAYQPMLIMILPPGAFVVLGVILAIVNKIDAKLAE